MFPGLDQSPQNIVHTVVSSRNFSVGYGRLMGSILGSPSDQSAITSRGELELELELGE